MRLILVAVVVLAFAGPALADDTSGVVTLPFVVTAQPSPCDPGDGINVEISPNTRVTGQIKITQDREVRPGYIAEEDVLTITDGVVGPLKLCTRLRSASQPGFYP